MTMRRRDFFSTAAVAGAGMMAANRLFAQETPARAGGPPKPPTYTPRIELLWKSPDRYPNALESSPEGLWVGDQVSERINLLDFTLPRLASVRSVRSTVTSRVTRL